MDRSDVRVVGKALDDKGATPVITAARAKVASKKPSEWTDRHGFGICKTSVDEVEAGRYR